jgi:hypothetical protein
MTYETLIDEPVKVWAFFDPSQSSGQAIRPIALSWRRRFIKFDKVIFKTTKKEGQTKIVGLICQGETANFELQYNLDNYSWKLIKMMPRE